MLSLATLAAAACARESERQLPDTTTATQQTQQTKVTTQVAVQSPESTARDTVPNAQPNAPRADSSAPAELTCSPKRFGPSDTVTIRMWTPHGQYLTVTRSDRISYFIIYPPIKSKPILSLMPSDEFANVAALRLPGDIRAMPYVYGRDTIVETVFGAPGKYLLQMGDNIGTDYGTPPPNCELTFTGPT